MLADSASNWHTDTLPGVYLHARRDAASPAAMKVIGDSIRVIRKEVLEFLSATDDERTPAHLFLMGSREAMQQRTGRPLSGFVQRNEKTGVFVNSPGYHIGPLLRHELTHLYAFEGWGQPTAGPWVVEGLAGWFAGPCQGHSPDALAAKLLVDRRLPTLDSLARWYYALPEDVGMPASSSIIGFVAGRDGIQRVRRMWKEETPAPHPLGGDGQLIEQLWRDSLKKVSPAALDIERVMREGC
jgi:hypothetical protein